MSNEQYSRGWYGVWRMKNKTNALVEFSKKKSFAEKYLNSLRFSPAEYLFFATVGVKNPLFENWMII